jgi:hypothetical protein
LTFNRDVRGCAYQATVGTSANSMGSWSSQSPPGHAAAAFAGGFSGNPASITVETFDAAGNFLAQDFHVVVFCDTIPPSAQALRANAQKSTKPLFKKAVIRFRASGRKGH